ncbi:MAG: 50S ribosomal protein L29 [Nitrososphaerota archaeon]|nr:50S ribosomal protein L29 [Nitrososphaerota archaeon]
MPIMRLKEIAEMSVEAQEQRLIDLRVELARIRTMVNAGGAVDNSARIRELRKTIAQILTIQNEQKLGLRKAPEVKKETKAKKPAKKDSKEKSSQ